MSKISRLDKCKYEAIKTGATHVDSDGVYWKWGDGNLLSFNPESKRPEWIDRVFVDDSVLNKFKLTGNPFDSEKEEDEALEEISYKEKSDGSTAPYYELPEGATELQHLISYRNMNAQDGEMFRALYRKGRASHSDQLRDAKKVLFYAKAEVERLEKYGS